MVYVDENGIQIENPDLTAGYLEDIDWVDHAAVAQTGHYEYAELAGGGMLQTYVVDTPAQAAYREVTKQRYIPYDTTGQEDTQQRLAALEDAMNALIGGASDV